MVDDKSSAFSFYVIFSKKVGINNGYIKKKRNFAH
jgi:hypothetical protein